MTGKIFDSTGSLIIESTCDSCIECGCNPVVCKCDCHTKKVSSVRPDLHLSFWKDRG